jgi:hypothetical protein
VRQLPEGRAVNGHGFDHGHGGESDESYVRRCSLPYDWAELADGDALAMVMDPAGTSWPWIVRPWSAADQRRMQHGCSCAYCAPHEQLTPLPQRYRAQQTRAQEHYRVREQPRCGAPTTTTTVACRVHVAQPGQRCRWHRAL